MAGVLRARRIALLLGAGAVALVLSGCAAASAVTTPTPSPSTSPSANDSTTPTPSPSASATPAPTVSAIDPGFVPTLAAIQMVGPRLGWAVGSHAIFATTDGVHWTKQYASTEEFVGVDFISASTGWAVATRTLLGTTDGGRSWHELGEPRTPIRSVHFASATQGWGIAGGGNPIANHGVLVPDAGASVVISTDGGSSWSTMASPVDPQGVCFSDPGHGWLASASGVLYASHDGANTWSKALEMFQSGDGVGRQTIIQCAAPSALWALMTIENGAGGHLPYVAYASQDGRNWRTVLTEPETIGNLLPGVPAGPDSHPGSLSIIDAADAVFIGDGPATNVAQCIIASNGGATLRRTGRIDNAAETFAAAFISLTSGWVLTRNAGGDYVIDATTDGGYHWAQQLAVPPTSAG
jgi:photosystem II stability/assembly factor-like uncharacterized protein